MQFVRELHDLDVSDLMTYLSKCQTPFEASNVYEVDTQTKRLDRSLRTSKFRALEDDPSLFQIVERLVDAMSESDPIMSFSLVKNNVTHIIYDRGGFFKAHQDFLSLTSNCIQVRHAKA